MADVSTFERFLIDRGVVGAQELPSPTKWEDTGNTIGSIALRLGMLNLEQIEEILKAQQSESRRFGELAVDREFLTDGQITQLLEIQQLHRHLHRAELMVMQKQVTLGQLLRLLSEFQDEAS